MIFAVGADAVPGLIDAAHHAGIRVGHAADEEIRRLDALRSEDIEDLVRIRRQRSIVEGGDNFLIGERQRFRILHPADPRQLAGLQHEHAAGSERVGIS